jgi:uncharacterized protein CbrC (UPF0167 family)
MEQLPRFRYHPDPIATHSIQPREGFTCGVCGEARSHAYIGPYFADNFGFENGDEICPWCIADGRAARDWNATFISPRQPDRRGSPRDAAGGAGGARAADAIVPLR